MLFGDPVAKRAEETSVAGRMLYHKFSGFEAEGMEILLGPGGKAEAAAARDPTLNH